MKKVFLSFLIFISVFLVACTATTTQTTQSTTTTSTTELTFVVSFDSVDGTSVDNQVVTNNGLATKPADPVKEGYQFVYWYSTDENVEYSFDSPVTANLELHALWNEVIDKVAVATEKINADILALEASLVVNPYQVDLSVNGANGSKITWRSKSEYITKTGIVLPVPEGVEVSVGELVGTFKLSGVTIQHTFEIPLMHEGAVQIATSKEVQFTNLTPEYDVADGNISLYFTEKGYVPYVSLLDFFTLLQGFIDPNTDFTIDTTEGVLTVSYQYYDEEEDHTYDLVLTVDSVNDTVSTNDPGFFWAYVYSTETNYGRHIEYDRDNEDASYVEGTDVVYEIGEYGMDVVDYNGQILLPYYLVNQLFAGSSYYNVYYNYDGLYGIYSLPSEGTDEYETIKTSTMNGDLLPGDLVVHTYNMLAFDMDYFYGLKDIMSVDTYYNVLSQRSDEFLVRDASAFDTAMRNFLLLDIDEPHTSYGYPSYFNSPEWSGPAVNSLDYYGTRFNEWYMDGMYDVDTAIMYKFGREGISSNAWAANSTSRPHYWFLDENKTSVVLILDDFNTSDIEEDVVFDSSYLNHPLDVEDSSVVLPAVEGGTKYFYYNSSSTEHNAAEMLVKGLSAAYLDTYAQSLLDAGYTLVQEETEDSSKTNGYYTKVIGDVSYSVQIAYDEELSLFYLGIIDLVPDTYEDSWGITADVFGTVYADSAVYMEFMMEAITEEAPNLVNIILDLSWNMGGNVGALYRVVGFVTGDPFKVSSMSRDTGSASTSYVMIDDGITHYDNLNWSLLTSKVTFSAANEMATIFKENNLGPIIGVQSGGGACSITPILLPNGTAFTMSSNSINAYRTGTSEDDYVYNNNEFGIVPDYPLTTGQLYSTTLLLQALASAYPTE